MNDQPAWALADLKDIENYESTPVLDRFPCQDLYALLRQSCSQYGDDPAMTFLPKGTLDDPATTISYRQLFKRITQTTNLLNSLGVRPDEAVSILLPNLPETHFALWGSAAAGIASPINPFLEPQHITAIINATGSRTLVTLAPDSDPDLWNKVCEVIQLTPCIKSVVLVSQTGVMAKNIPGSPRNGLEMIDYQQQVKLEDADKLVSGRIFSPNDTAMYLHTGGTTGCPKVAKLKQANLAFMAQLYAQMNDKRGQFTALCGLPLFHVFGINATGLSAFTGGRHMVMLTPSGFRNPDVIRNFWHFVHRFKPTTFACVPTILSALMDIPIEGNDISSLKDVTVGAAPLPLQLKDIFTKRFGISVLNGYGMTESSLLLTRGSPDFPPPLDSVGLRSPYLNLIIAEVKNDKLIRKCVAHESGTILVRGPNIIPGYLNPEDNSGAWIDEQWFNTRDLGYLDEKGYLFLTGRSSDLIIRGGHNISPALIEDPLSRHPAVAQVVAIAQPDPYAGEIPVAYVTLKNGKITDTENLLAFCGENISERAAIPKRIEIIEHIPLTSVAKIFKPALRQRATEYALGATLEKAGIKAEIEARTDPHTGLIAAVKLCRPDQLAEAKEQLQNYPLIIEYS